VDKPKVQFREPEELLRPYTDDNLRHELIREDFPELANAPITPSKQVILHKLAHLMEHDKKCNAHVELIIDDITRFLLAEPNPARRQIPQPWLNAAKAINPEYLPTRFTAVLGNLTGPSREKEVRAMAHEFLAELIPAVAWQNKEIHLDPDCPSSLKGLHDYIRKNGKTLSAAKIKKLSTRTIRLEKESIVIHSDYVADHGRSPGARSR
jgi:hypothetical protein